LFHYFEFLIKGCNLSQKYNFNKNFILFNIIKYNINITIITFNFKKTREVIGFKAIALQTELVFCKNKSEISNQNKNIKIVISLSFLQFGKEL